MMAKGDGSQGGSVAEAGGGGWAITNAARAAGGVSCILIMFGLFFSWTGASLPIYHSIHKSIPS